MEILNVITLIALIILAVGYILMLGLAVLSYYIVKQKILKEDDWLNEKDIKELKNTTKLSVIIHVTVYTFIFIALAVIIGIIYMIVKGVL